MPLDGGFAYVGAGWNHSCGLRPNGSVSCWGEDDHEQSRPPEVLFAQLSTGEWHNCGLTTIGTVACWGADK